jgi:drug/metabolite transporter (DMT)-like permease
LAAILIATTPLFSILAAHWLTTDETMTANKIAGILLGIAGVAILVGEGSLSGSERAFIPLLACLAAAISYGFANVFGRPFRRMGIVPVVGAFGQIAATAVMIAPIAIAVDAPWRLMAPAPSVWAATAGLALLSTALGYVIFFRVLASAGGTNISLVTLLIPVSTILFGRAILGERLPAAQFAGMALIAVGLVAFDGRAWSAIRNFARAAPRTNAVRIAAQLMVYSPSRLTISSWVGHLSTSRAGSTAGNHADPLVDSKPVPHRVQHPSAG